MAKVVRKKSQGKKVTKAKLNKNEPVNFTNYKNIKKRAETFADHIESHFEEIADILLEYESFEVVKDETSRTLDILRSLDENKEYFSDKIGSFAAFLPRNQPLYALTCFVIIPSLMAKEVHFRIPHSMRHFFPRLLRTLKTEKFFPNVHVSDKERLKFLKEMSALRINPKNDESMPVTDAVIFTGTSYHADKLRLIFDQRTLFIANGSGHNPVIITEDADLYKAVDAVLTLCLYNQGQDCAAPNSVIVHSNSLQPFLRILHEELKKVKVGQYRDRSCRVGPISDPDDLVRIQEILVENQNWLDPETPGIIRAKDSIVEPTIICKPLSEGANFSEVFAPIIFIQSYTNNSELSDYFENPKYALNAMYLTVYGTNKFVDDFFSKKNKTGKILHDETTILHDTHLHAPGIERGTQPYGGFGYAASSFSINGKITAKPTLPQREIFEQVIKPLLLDKNKRELKKKSSKNMSKIVTKDVSKMLLLKKAEANQSENRSYSGMSYVDALDIIASDKQRYIEFTPERIFVLLQNPNVEHIAIMEPKYIKHIKTLRKILLKHRAMNYDEFSGLLYAIPKKPGANEKENKVEQLNFFRHIYQLLFGTTSGPRLAQFLLDASPKHILDLLDI